MRLGQLRRHPRITTTLSILLTLAIVSAGCTTAPRSGTEPGTGRLDPRTLVGWWVVELTSPGGAGTFGLAQAEETAEGGVRWKVEMASGGAAILEGQPPEGARMRATWGEPGAGTTDGPGFLLSAGEAGPDRLVGAATDGAQLTLHRVSPPEQADSGAYRRLSDGATVIVALDVGLGEKPAGFSRMGAFSVLDPDGYWPWEGRFKAYLGPDDPRLIGSGIVVARFDAGGPGGARLYVCRGDPEAAACDLLERSAPASNRSGVWLGRSKRYDDVPEWFYAVVVEAGEFLYVHERDETYLDNDLDWTLRARDQGGSTYLDSDLENYLGVPWKVRASADGAWLMGEFDEGGPEVRSFHSLQRLGDPPAGFLTGDASSLSLDWMDAPPTGPVPVIGQARLEQQGAHLRIVDRSGDGATYVVEAEWTGYQYEGTWFPAEDPGSASPWRGQLTADGWYLHGTWVFGEYSFSFAPLVGSSEVSAASPGGQPVVTQNPDPTSPVALTFHDGRAGLTLLRNGTRLERAELVAADGRRLTIDHDERWRITRIVTSDGHEALYDWADDASWVDVSVDGEPLPRYYPDWSPAGLRALAGQVLAQEGRPDLAEPAQALFDDGVEDVLAILRGEQPAPELVPGALATPVLRGGGLGVGFWMFGQWVGSNSNAGRVATQTSGAIGLVTWGASFLGLAGTTSVAGTYLGLALVGSGAVLAFFVILNIALWIVGAECGTCSLLCFVNCFGT